LALTVGHKPFEGSAYLSGINGHRVAILGYSHWNGDPDRDDYDKFTIDVMRDVINATYRPSFFTRIAGFFDAGDPALFWKKVLFFNYLPQCIGGKAERFDVADESWSNSANERFRCILEAHVPDKVIVFTSKGWGSLPPFDAAIPYTFDTSGLVGAVLRDPCGLYKVGSKSIIAFGLRHPQGAPAKAMSLAVRQILEFPIVPR
jgi:hypothetical protein